MTEETKKRLQKIIEEDTRIDYEHFMLGAETTWELAIQEERKRIKTALTQSDHWLHRKCPSWVHVAVNKILNPEKETK